MRCGSTASGGSVDPSPTSLDDGVIEIGALEIAQLANNPNFPERGKLALGGRRRQMTTPMPDLKPHVPPLAPGSECCGCCDGIAAETPQGIDNRAGLSAIAYRIGDYAAVPRQPARGAVVLRLRAADARCARATTTTSRSA